METFLKPLRANPTAILPPDEWINWEPISLQRDRAIWQTYCQQVSWLSQLDAQTFPPYQVVIDLDDTLLLNSYTSPELWKIGEGYQDEAIYPAYKYSKMRKTWQGRFKRVLGRTHYDTADHRAYPFLRNPRHIVMFRPGMLSGLAWLAQRGVEFILVTASAQQRVRYLLKRFPMLVEVFGNRIISADDMVQYYLTQATSEEQIQDQASRQAFKKRPFSLGIKTPDLVNQILGNGGYDLIVDDSEVLAETLSGTPLRDRAVWVRSDLAISSYGVQIVAEITARMMGKPISQESNLKRLEPNSESFSIPLSGDQLIRLEDPYYWPLCHRHDQLKFSSGG
ncbi:MAG: HAD family hydrolase [Halothece sp.]